MSPGTLLLQELVPELVQVQQVLRELPAVQVGVQGRWEQRATGGSPAQKEKRIQEC